MAIKAVLFFSFSAQAFASGFLQTRPHTEKSMSRSMVHQALSVTLSMDVSALRQFEDELRPMYTALPKSVTGALEPPVVRYALHRYFVQKHGWHLKGLEPAELRANASSPASILKDQVPEYVQSLLEQHVSGQGWHLHELAICAAALSELIKREVVQDLEFVYGMLALSTSNMLDGAQLESVIDMYLAQYLVDEGFTDMTPHGIMKEIKETYDRWGDLSMWAKDVQRTLDFAEAPRNNPFVARTAGSSFWHVAKIVQDIMDHYTTFQNIECSRMTDLMLDMEHQSTGRVPLARFYEAGVADLWQFWEPKEYLQHAGTLDESDPKRPTVIIPNYVYGMNNCLASSSFFAVCCTNKCEQLVGHLERELGSPNAPSQRIADLVSLLPSDTVDAPRSLPAQLLARLQEIAVHHGGEVPLHGRLFSQWLHHAYPRECPFPHVDAERNPLTPEAWAEQAGRDYSLTDAEMQRHIRRHSHGAQDHSEGLPWAATEELVGRHHHGHQAASSWWQKAMALTAVAAFALSLLRALDATLGLSTPQVKNYSV